MFWSPGCTANSLCLTVGFPWILAQLVGRLRSLWRCDLKTRGTGQRSIKQLLSSSPFSLHPSLIFFLFFIVLFFPPLHPYVSTGSGAGLCCLASGRTVALPSPRLVLWTLWSKAEWEPLQRLPCCPDPAATCAPARTRLRNERKEDIQIHSLTLILKRDERK